MRRTARHISRDGGTGALGLCPVRGAEEFFRLYGTGGDCMFLYFITEPASGAYETGAGHLKDVVTLVRDCVIASSAYGARVNFGAAEKIIGGLA